MAPAATLADGRASTRNIILGVGAATYLIIQHNRKVHQRYAEDARRQAELSQQRNDAWSAYNSERAAYQQQLAANADLRREVAYQHHIISQQRQQLAMAPTRRGFTQTVSMTSASKRMRAGGRQVAMTSYGWGRL
ncbi:MAG: hypothetical protein M3N13_09735 [Candidatus Eremiobacteraeota bacterium]|nr:hypothetical protein [Candidatus Eremiobacteraeota bacterium]